MYNDIEVQDVSALLNEKISLDEVYGESIKVRLNVNFETEVMTRSVREDASLVRSDKMHYNIDSSYTEVIEVNAHYEKDPVLLDLDK